LKSYGDFVYFTVKTASVDKEGKATLTSTGLYQLNNTTGQTLCIFNSNITDYCIDPEKNVIYYFINSEGLYQYDVIEGNSKQVFKCSEESASCRLSFDGEHIYMDNISWKAYSKFFMKLDIKITPTIWIFDRDANLVKEIDLRTSSIISLFYGDKSCLFAEIGMETIGFQNAYVEKENLLNSEDGKMDWIPMK
jgi:hypothetical protein